MREKVYCLGALTAITFVPLILFLISREWLFTPLSWLDPYYYIGYGLHYLEPNFLPTYYKISRLPWVLVQFAARHILSDLGANYVIDISSIILLSVGLFLALRRMFGFFAAFVVALISVTDVELHGSGGWEYHNTGSGVFYSWTLYFLVRALFAHGRGEDRAWWMTFGVFAALTIHSNILFAVPIVLLALYWLASTTDDRRKSPSVSSAPIASRVGKIAVLSSGGAAIATGILGLINLWAGRDFLFFAPMYRLSVNFASDANASASWWKPLGSWVFDPPYFYLSLPFACAIVCAGYLACDLVSRARNNSLQRTTINSADTAYASDRLPFARAASWHIILLVVIWIALQASGRVTLNYDYFAYPLIQPALTAIAALIAASFRGGRMENGLIEIVAIVALPIWAIVTMGFPSYLPFHLGDLLPTAAVLFKDVGIYIACIAAIAGGGILISRRYAQLWLLLPVATIILANTQLSARQSNYIYDTAGKCTLKPTLYKLLLDASRFVSAYSDHFSKRTMIWFDEEKGETLRFSESVNCPAPIPVAYFGYSLVATGFEYFPRAFPVPQLEEISEDDLRKVAETRPVIAIISADPSHAYYLIERLRILGFRFAATASLDAGKDGISIPIVVLEPS